MGDININGITNTPLENNAIHFDNEFEDKSKVKKEIRNNETETSFLTDEDLIEILLDEKDTSIDSDGVIGKTYQGTVNDCGALAGINALAQSATGQKLLKNAIKDNGDGTFSVTFKGIDKTYTFSQDDFSKYSLSHGDDDMKILEMGLIKFREDLKLNPQEFSSLPDKINTLGLENEKNPAEGGNGTQIIYLLSGVESELYNDRLYHLKLSMHKDVKSLDEFLNEFQKNPQNYAMTVSFSTNDEYTRTLHEYTVKDVKDDSITVINPWNSSVEIKIPKDKFIENIDSLNSCDISKADKKGFFQTIWDKITGN